MKVTKHELNKMVTEAVSSLLKESAQDKAVIHSLKPAFATALKTINDGLRAYSAVMAELQKNSTNERVKDIGLRGTETAQHELDRWRTIADDLYVAEWEVDYDNNPEAMHDEDQARIAAYGDEHDNRDTLGEPKL